MGLADYTIISDVGNALVKLFRENMVPDVIPNADAIGLCSPADKGDFVLGVYLYDVRESEEIFESGMKMSGSDEQRFPSKYLSLYYMLTAYSMSDLKFRSSEEHRILGRAVQILMDHSNLDSGLPEQGKSAYPVRAELLRMDNEEKMKLWNMPNIPYKLSLYYKVSPVEIESTRVRKIHRVSEIDMEFWQK